MAKAFLPKVLTGNDVIGGHSVFLTAEGWSASIADDLVAGTPQQVEELQALAHSNGGASDVIGLYAVDVALQAGAPEPVLRRERIRASGQPSVPIGLDAPLSRAA